MQPVRDAATVMLLRDSPQLEVFLLRRHSRSSFMANAWVYPGGQLDPGDVHPENRDVICGVSPEAAAKMLRTSSEKAIGLFLAAVRETFEESGILLVSKNSEALDAAKRGEYREKLQNQQMSLLEVARHEDLQFDLAELAFFAHWITPVSEPKRFDTRFFVARAPGEQIAEHDSLETTASMWATPGEVLDLARDSEILLAPPTIRTLEQIADFDSAGSALTWANSEVPPCLIPHFDNLEGAGTLLLPGDPLYPPNTYANAEPVSDGITRMVMDGSFWQSEKA